jgi:ubiquinone/menaquinone biosynthesis C-methylase UbiE
MSEIDQEKEKLFWQKEYAAIYHHLEKSTPYRKLVEDTVKLIPFKEGDIILDLGCGSGALMREIWRKSEGKIKEIIGLDFAPLQLEIAEKKIINDILPEEREKFKFILHDLKKKFSFPDNYFDHIVAGLVIPYIYEHEGKKGGEALLSLLKEIRRILRKEGYLVWSTPIKNVQFWKVFLASFKDILDLREPERLILGPKILKHALKIQRKGKEKIYNFLDAQEIVPLHKLAGFEKVYFENSFAGQAWIIQAQK